MANLALLLSMLCNIFLTITKILAGYICNYKSLIADGVHSLSDLSTDIIAILGNRLADKPADNDHPHGHGRINYVTSVLIGFFILFIGFSLFKGSFNYSYTKVRGITIVVVIITIVLKLLVSRLLIITGKKENNNILLASGKESFTDVFSSLLVLVTLILGLFSESIPAFKYMDMVGSIIISVIIMVVGIRILVSNFSSLLGQIEVSPHKISKIKEYLHERYDVKIRDVLLVKYGTYYQAFIEIEVNKKLSVVKLKELIDSLKNDLINSKFNIKYVHIDFEIRK